jgi:hypothetical protein
VHQDEVSGSRPDSNKGNRKLELKLKMRDVDWYCSIEVVSANKSFIEVVGKGSVTSIGVAFDTNLICID